MCHERDYLTSMHKIILHKQTCRLNQSFNDLINQKYNCNISVTKKKQLNYTDQNL